MEIDIFQETELLLLWLKQRSGGQKQPNPIVCFGFLPHQPESQTVNHAIYSFQDIDDDPPLSRQHFIPLQCEPQCRCKNLTLPRRVLKKSFQIPLTRVTALFELRGRCSWTFVSKLPCTPSALNFSPRAQNAKKICQQGKTTILNHICQSRPSKMDF